MTTTTQITGTYYVHASELGEGATEQSARDFATVARRHFDHLGHDVTVVVGAGLSDPELRDAGNDAFDVFCAEGFDVDATCARLGC
jgi:hypothetical protein